MPYLKTQRGLNWHYQLVGEGPTLLFLHGFGVNSRIWRQQIKYFSDNYRIIAVDLPGHGQSDWQNISLTDMGEDIEFLLQHLGCQQVGIVASSFGGLVALKIFELNQGRIKFFVFAGSQPKFCACEDYPFGLPPERIAKLAAQLQTDYPSMVNVFFRSLFTPSERATRRFKWVQTFRKTDFLPRKEALLALLVILEKEDLRSIFYAQQRPILFINGSEDYICPKSFYESLQGKIPMAHFVWFNACGHFPFISRPHEFNGALAGFLENQRI